MAVDVTGLRQCTCYFYRFSIGKLHRWGQGVLQALLVAVLPRLFSEQGKRGRAAEPHYLPRCALQCCGRD